MEDPIEKTLREVFEQHIKKLLENPEEFLKRFPPVPPSLPDVHKVFYLDYQYGTLHIEDTFCPDCFSADPCGCGSERIPNANITLI